MDTTTYDMNAIEMLAPTNHTPDPAEQKAIVAQCRAARAILNWSQDVLAYEAGVTLLTISNFERGVGSARLSTVTRIQNAFEKAGVEFICADETGGVGLRLRR